MINMVDKIILASHNEHKVNEIKMILNDIDIVSLSSINELEEPEENGKDLFHINRDETLLRIRFFKKRHEDSVGKGTG